MENILSGNPLLNYASQVQKGDLKVSGWGTVAVTLVIWYPSLLNMCCIYRWSGGGMMMWCSRTVHGLSQIRRRINNSSMTHCAPSSTANSWKSMSSEHMPSKTHRQVHSLRCEGIKRPPTPPPVTVIILHNFLASLTQTSKDRQINCSVSFITYFIET